MWVIFFSKCSPKVLLLAIANKNLILNFGQTKKQIHKHQSKFTIIQEHVVNNRALIKHFSLKRMKESFRNISQERSGFSSGESHSLH